MYKYLIRKTNVISLELVIIVLARHRVCILQLSTHFVLLLKYVKYRLLRVMKTVSIFFIFIENNCSIMFPHQSALRFSTAYIPVYSRTLLSTRVFLICSADEHDFAFDGQKNNNNKLLFLFVYRIINSSNSTGIRLVNAKTYGAHTALLMLTVYSSVSIIFFSYFFFDCVKSIGKEKSINKLEFGKIGNK